MTVQELGWTFDLNRSLRFGHLPVAQLDRNPGEYLKSYVRTYLREEVQQEGLTRNLGAFSRFLEAASFSQAFPLNISAVSRDCSVERKVVEDYFTILEDLLLAVRIPVFTKRAKRHMVAHPKFYYFDVGVFRAIRPRGPLDAPEETDGAGFETLLLQEIRALNEYLDLEYGIHYWRTPTGLEVDFVLYGERGIRAFEVKRTSRYRPADCGSLRAFLDDYPMAKAWLLYGGSQTYHEGPITVLPFETALRRLPDLLA